MLEFRASIVIGSGSLSFEMIRSLVKRLPIMITPKWVSVKAQPIAIDDLIAYLIVALHLPASEKQPGSARPGRPLVASTHAQETRGRPAGRTYNRALRESEPGAQKLGNCRAKSIWCLRIRGRISYQTSTKILNLDDLSAAPSFQDTLLSVEYRS